MALLENLITSGRIIDLMLLFIALEVIVLISLRRLRGGGIPTVPLLVNIGAGGSLMLALRAVLQGSAWTMVAGFLVLSLIFHVADLFIRWQTPTADQDAA